MSSPRLLSTANSASPPVEDVDKSKEYESSPPNGSTSSNDDAEKASEPKAPGSDAPDGGLAAWLIVFGVWCTSFCTFGWLNSTSSRFQTCIAETDRI
jgi:hypothetical protein